MIGVLIVTVVGIIAFSLIPTITSGVNSQVNTQLVEDPNKLTIGITGEIVKPGNYLMDEGSTLAALIDKAGGVNYNADERAYFVDASIDANQEYYIAPKYDSKDICGDTIIQKVNINDSDKDELMTISGIGDAVSTAIINYRNLNGIFYHIEDIMNVTGIGNSTFAKIKDYIYLHE